MTLPPEATETMDDGPSGSIRHEIARLEDRIEALAQSIERCRKFSLAAKSAITAGVIWLSLALTGIVAINPTGLFASLSAMIGGVVLLGSNSTTWTQTEAELHATEAARANLIGRIGLRLVGEETPTIH